MPPRPGRGDLLQVLRPEKPTLSAREIYIYGHVPLCPVTVRNPARHATSLGDPMMLARPYGRTDRDSVWLHETPPATGRHNTGLSRVRRRTPLQRPPRRTQGRRPGSRRCAGHVLLKAPGPGVSRAGVLAPRRTASRRLRLLSDGGSGIATHASLCSFLSTRSRTSALRASPAAGMGGDSAASPQDLD